MLFRWLRALTGRLSLASGGCLFVEAGVAQMERVRPSILLQPHKAAGQHWLYQSHLDAEEAAESKRVERERLRRQARDRALLEQLSSEPGPDIVSAHRQHLAFLQEQARCEQQTRREARIEQERQELAQLLMREQAAEDKAKEQERARRAFHAAIMQENVMTAENKREQRHMEKIQHNAAERARIEREHFERKFASSLR